MPLNMSWGWYTGLMKDLMKLKREFLEYLEIERGRSKKTVENYGRYLGRFFDFGKIKKPADISVQLVDAFRLHLSRQPGAKVGGRRRNMKRRTQNYYLVAIRAFVKYLQGLGLAVFEPEQILLTKVPKRSPKFMSQTELSRLVRAPDQKTLEGKRDKAILEIISSTGLRVSELCGLCIGDVDLSSAELVVREGGEKERVVSLSDSARVALQAYLQNRKDLDDALFVRYGRKVNDGGDLRISPKVVQRLVKKYAIVAGVGSKVTPQSLRHSFAVRLLQTDTDQQSVQTQLGYESSSAAKAYTQELTRQLLGKKSQ